MQRWKEEFVGHAHKKCVQINRNGVFDQGKILYMEPEWDCLDLLNAASQRMDMVPAAKRVFNADGSEIDDCMMIVDDDILFFSKAEDFIAPESLANDGPTQSGRESERLPNSVGGYKVGEMLGKGGFGEVRLGEHQLTGEKVALKFLRKAEIHSLGAAERTNTEIQCLATLKHMNIIKMIQHLESANHVVLIFELMEGGDLMKFLLRRGGVSPTNGSSTKVAPTASSAPEDHVYPQSRCTLSEDEARHTFYQVVSAISYAHNQHICHRDLKLENILLKDNSLSVVKIADFGLSDFYRPGATMKSSCGTLSFLAPEVFKGTSNAGPPLDVWSLGVILFTMLCGRMPFEGPDLIGTKRPREQIIKSRIMKCQYKIDDHLGPEVKDLVRRMLQVDPTERASIPEIFNHVWMRAAVGGCLPESIIMQSPPNMAVMQSSKILPSTPETGTPLLGGKSVKIFEDDEGDVIPPLERADSLPSYNISKQGRHRSSFSAGGMSGGITGLGRSTSSFSSTKSAASSSADLVALEALVAAAEAPLMCAGSPPLSARRHSHARLSMLLSPSRDGTPAGLEKQLSNASLDLSAEPTTPRSNFSPSPFSVQVEEQFAPSLVSNKAFKLVPLRRQVTNESRNSDASDFSSPGACKVRSYSTSDAASAGITTSGGRPVTGRRPGSIYGDYDDDDDSLGTSNWRNITLDPAPSVGNPPAPTASPATTATSSASSRKHTISSVGSTKVRKETLSHTRTSFSSGALNASPSSASGRDGKDSREKDREREKEGRDSMSTKVRAVFSTAVNSGIAAISPAPPDSHRR